MIIFLLVLILLVLFAIYGRMLQLSKQINPGESGAVVIFSQQSMEQLQAERREEEKRIEERERRRRAEIENNPRIN